MEFLKELIDVMLHLDKHLDAFVAQFGPWLYVLLFLIIFCETGLVVTPFLPGDSLLFAIGTLTARPDGLNLWIVLVSLSIAAVLGDSVNYWIGYFLGEKLQKKYPRLIKPKYLERTHAFFERYGGKTIILARFVPIVRTFAPFVAGVGKMTYSRFMLFNVTGGLFWVVFLVLVGHFFGNLPIIRDNFSLAVLAIIFLSLLPAVFEYVRERRRRKPASVNEEKSDATA
jgi:membrane-associated protein